MTVFTLTTVLGWMFIMIILPQLFMVDYSLRFNLPAAEIGGPNDVYTIDNYKFLIYGSAKKTGVYNTVDLSVFFRTILAAVFVTLFDPLETLSVGFRLHA